jgi:hypothetical protein
MRKRSSTKPRQTDENVRAFDTVKIATERKQEPEEKNPAAVALGRLGGLKGGKARAKSISPERRSEIAHLAATTRWSRRKKR